MPTLDHIAPSILSKKLAEGAATLVLDVKVGAGAFAIDDVGTAAGQFFGMIIQPVQMELSIGVRKKVTAKEIAAIVSKAVEAFMRLYAK